MKRLLSYFLVFLVSANWLLAQTSANESFNRSFLHIYMHTASEDVNLALKSADSLYQTAVSDIHKIRSLMLISDMYHRMANRDSSIHYAVKAERIAEQADNYVWQARICGVLSTQHRETGLYNAGRRYIEKGLKVIEKVANPEAANQFKGQCFQELGFYDVEEGRYEEAISNFRRAEPFFVDLPDTVVRYFALAQNDERIGLCHLELEALDSAAFYYNRALALEQKASKAGTPVKGFIYNGLGRVHLADKHYEQADSCFHQALAIAEATGLPNLKISVYKDLARYYRLTGNDEKHRRYNDKYLKEIEENTIKHKRYADHVIARIERRLENMTASNKVLSLTASVLIVFMGVGMGLYVRRQRKNYQRYQAIIRALKNQGTEVLVNEQTATNGEMDREKNIMPENTKQELLKKLERFESSQQFTDRNISIAVLAGKMKTNTKYLSYIINNYRNKDFNGYVNELRVNYIIAKMETDSRYLNYKISYLAEECGFATHSQFTTVFRNITGLSPSTFITYLRKDGQMEDKVLLN
ncbi:helix-turn-helix domain-containing protein [Parapedobacter indicus]|uniref:Helix-turn-helix domain-containing protein n=1 Tax=Parapedobacter indicus TaxID=1477437 RepID=A0A1I3CQ09_9SPHI|nr:helix-turn-helix domain-containing protein [Parapedobacter indicus]PPL04341.1 helix-turn-helix protein [Parapedobacter indicus]SFH76416.1 Helix-turn-helix domain-containing protein [Parapedobacter indicus]